MTNEDLLKLEWVEIEDWSRLPETFHKGNETYTKKQDVYCFLNLVIREISRQADLPYRKVKAIVYRENKEALYYVKQVFDGYIWKLQDKEMKILRKMLKVPRITYSADNILYTYNLLSSKEKESFRRIIL